AVRQAGRIAQMLRDLGAGVINTGNSEQASINTAISDQNKLISDTFKPLSEFGKRLKYVSHRLGLNRNESGSLEGLAPGIYTDDGSQNLVRSGPSPDGKSWNVI